MSGYRGSGAKHHLSELYISEEPLTEDGTRPDGRASVCVSFWPVRLKKIVIERRRRSGEEFE
jgi:hypothetical protein